MKERIKSVRMLRGLTQRQLGEKIGRTASYISKVETGAITLYDVEKMADALGVREEWLVTGAGEMTDRELTRDRRSVSERLIQVRKERKLTQTVMAERIGVSRNTISLLERKKVGVSPAVIRSVVETMDVDEHWLRTGEKLSRVQEIKEWLSSHPTDKEKIREWVKDKEGL